jgi:hypothetical protein
MVQIASNLFRLKLKDVLQVPGNQLAICCLCGALFTAIQSRSHPCPNANLQFDVHGHVLRKHECDSQGCRPPIFWFLAFFNIFIFAMELIVFAVGGWDLNTCLTGLRAQGVAWSQIFWQFWALVTDLPCSLCGRFLLL